MADRFEGLALFSLSSEERARAEQMIRSDERTARHQRGESDDDFIEEKLRAVRNSYDAMETVSRSDKIALGKAINDLAEKAGQAYEAISDSLESTGEAPEWLREAREYRVGGGIDSLRGCPDSRGRLFRRNPRRADFYRPEGIKDDGRDEAEAVTLRPGRLPHLPLRARATLAVRIGSRRGQNADGGAVLHDRFASAIS